MTRGMQNIFVQNFVNVSILITISHRQKQLIVLPSTAFINRQSRIRVNKCRSFHYVNTRAKIYIFTNQQVPK